MTSLFPPSALFSKKGAWMKLADIPLGRILNFQGLTLTEGVSRLILPGANNLQSHRAGRANRDPNLRYLCFLLFKPPIRQMSKLFVSCSSGRLPARGNYRAALLVASFPAGFNSRNSTLRKSIGLPWFCTMK